MLAKPGHLFPLWEVVELDGSTDRLSNPWLLHISDTTEHGQSLLILGQPISKLAAKSASPDRRRFSTGLYLNRRRLSIMRWVSLLGL